jgi:hypothetical protein
VRRGVLVLFLAMLTFDVSGLAAICGDPPCGEECPADASGDCAPNCHACSCCSLPKVTAGGAVDLVAPAARRTAWIGAADHLLSPAPAEILHIPKSSLA